MPKTKPWNAGYDEKVFARGSAETVILVQRTRASKHGVLLCAAEQVGGTHGGGGSGLAGARECTVGTGRGGQVMGVITIRQSDNPTILQSNNPTIRQSNNPSIQQSVNPTIQRRNALEAQLNLAQPCSLDRCVFQGTATETLHGDPRNPRLWLPAIGTCCWQLLATVAGNWYLLLATG